MTDTTSQPANTTERWYVRAWAALRSAISSAPLLWARVRTATGQALAWFMDNPVVMAVLIVLAAVSVAALVSRHPLPAPSSAAAPIADQIQPLEARVSTLEAAVASLLAAEAAPTTAPPRTRAAAVRQRAPAGPVVPESEPPAAAEPAPAVALPPITRQSLKQFRAELRGQE